MGSKQSKSEPNQIGEIMQYCEQLNQSVANLQEKIDSVNQDYICRSEIEPRINLLEKSNTKLNEKLSHLLAVAKDQQKIIMDLSGKYSNLCNEYEKQTQALFDMEYKFLEQIKEYQEELKQTREKLSELEKEITVTSDMSKVLGIKKAENLIKKDKTSPRLSLVLNTNPDRNSEVRNKLRGKLQEYRSQRKAGKDPAYSSELDTENQNILQEIEHLKKINGNPTNRKESLAELDINTIQQA